MKRRSSKLVKCGISSKKVKSSLKDFLGYQYFSIGISGVGKKTNLVVTVFEDFDF